jgi:transcriptional regulator with XRE-family HTH domain
MKTTVTTKAPIDLKVRARSRGRTHLPEVDRVLQNAEKGRTARTGAQRDAFRAAVADAVRSRGLRELAEIDVRRSIFRLADEGMSQRQIAQVVGLSQPEVSRRLKRRSFTPTEPSPREIILSRAAGVLSTKAMMDALGAMALTAEPPSASARFDGAATSTGSAKQLAASFQDGLLTKGEYEKLRKSIRIAHPRRAA